MADPYIGEIRAVAFNYAPQGWMLCDGSTLPINQYQALFSLLGTNFGGNGANTFGLPDLRGRMIAGVGPGPGLSAVSLGQKAGANAAQLTLANLPPHTHMAAVTDPGHTHPVTVPAHTHPFSVPCAPANTTATQNDPTGNLLANTSAIGNAVSALGGPGSVPLYAPSSGTTGSMASGNTGNPSSTPAGTSGSAATGINITNSVTGSGIPVSTEPPFLGLYYIIATQGLYPSRP